MSRFLKILLVLTLICSSVGPAWPQPVTLPPPLPPNVAPQWAPAPGSPAVAFAPNIPGNLFRLHRKYFFYYEGQWYRGKTPLGPWFPVRKVPKALLRLHPAAFK